MWNVNEDKFIHNDTQYEVVLIIEGLVRYEYAYPKTRKLYDSLTTEEINHIKKRLEKIKKRD